MPELPDVEHARRFLARHAGGRRIERTVVTDHGILRNVTARTLGRALRDQRFEDPDRHGKWLIAWTTGPVVLLHFGMTGELVQGDGPSDRHRHDRVIFELDRGELRYRNMRKLGGLWMAHNEDEAREVMGALGPDALGLGRRHFHQLLGARRGRVKATLMNQAVLAGVGNLIADEALWHARLHPARPIPSLTDTERDRLFEGLREVLRTSVEATGGVARPEGWLLAVRGRPDARCPRCGTELERSTVAGRTTYHCPRCQAAVQ
jgi:formamidopyrimidine-DNA glycosylase